MALMATKTKTTFIGKATSQRPTFVAAKEAKNRFGELMEAAQRHPIIITRNNRPIARIMRYSEKTAFQEMEDKIWGERAMRAEKEGSLSPEESEAFLERMRQRTDAHSKTR